MSEFQQLIDLIKEDVKCEDELVELTLYTAFSAWSKDPLNLVFKGESSIGKTWIVKNVVKYFPKESVWLLGGMTPKAILHLPSKPIDEEDKEIQKPIFTKEMTREERERRIEEYREKMENARWLIELERKILVFLEAPDREVFRIFRPILSHDAWEIEFPFTEKTREGSLLTKRILIRGFPATIWCCATMPWMEEFVTRSLTVTPRESPEKFKAAHGVTILRNIEIFYEKKYNEKLERGRNLVNKILSDFRKDVLIPYGEDLKENYPFSQRRDMRDFNYFRNLIEVHTNLNQHPSLYHPVLGEKKIATLKDLYEVEKIWKYLYPTTVFGISETTLRLIQILSENTNRDLTAEDIRQLYMRKYRLFISYSSVIHKLNQLVEIGLLIKRTHPEDKRVNVFYLSEKIADIAFSIFATISSLFSKNKLESFLKNIATELAEYRETRLNLPDEEPLIFFNTPLEVLVEKLYQKLLYTPPSVAIISNSNSGFKSENNSENIAFQKNAISAIFSNGKEAGK